MRTHQGVIDYTGTEKAIFFHTSVIAKIFSRVIHPYFKYYKVGVDKIKLNGIFTTVKTRAAFTLTLWTPYYTKVYMSYKANV